MKMDVLTLENKVAGSVDLPKDIFGLEVKKDILHRVVVWQLAKRRSGNHKTKTVSEISGTGKKPFKQKGTGSARQGSLRSVQMRGGAVAFGPVVRDHGFSLPKKVRALGLKMALSTKVLDKNLIVWDSEKVSDMKTQNLKSKLDAFGLDKVLIITGKEMDENFKKASANIKHLDRLVSAGLNVYDILKHEKLIITKDALEDIKARFANK